MISKPEDMIHEIVADFGFSLLGVETHRGVWRLKTTGGIKYLKKSKFGPSDLLFINEVLEYLRRQSFNHVIRLAVSRYGTPYTMRETGCYILTDWYTSRELDFRILMDLKQAIRLMVEFHRKGEGFTPVGEIAERACWLTWPAKMLNRINQLRDFRRLALEERESSPFSRLFLQYYEPYYRQAIASYQMLLASPYYEVALCDHYRRTLCHHDYSARNLLRVYTDQLMLVDFDYCLRDIRIHDLINLIVRNLKHNEWDPGLCRFILQEYHEEGKLTPGEIEVMYVLLNWPQDFWQVGLQYYYEKLPWPAERFLKKLQSKIESRFAREKFLKDFPEQNGIYEWKAPKTEISTCYPSTRMTSIEK